MNILRKRIKGLLKKYNPLLLNNYNVVKIPSAGLGYVTNSEFNPISVPNMKIWCEADYGITLNGSTVSQWLDKSGNNNHMIQNTASFQPTLTASAINGLPALTFDGSNDGMNSTSTITGLSNMTFFIVYKRRINTSQIVLFGDDNTYQYLQYGSSFLIGNASKNSSMTNNVWYLRAGTGSGINNEWFSNGSSLGTGTTAGAFSYFNKLGNPGAGAPLDGLVYGFMIFNRVLTSDEILSINTYWNQKLSIY